MEKKASFKKLLANKTFLLSVLTVIVIVIMWALKPAFLARGNVRTLLNDISIIAIMMCGVVPLLISGNINLAAASEAALGSVIYAQILQAWPAIPWGIALIMALAAGACFALLVLFLSRVVGIMPFIATLGLSSVYTGLGSLWTGSNNVMINRQTFVGINKIAIGNWVPLMFVFSVVLVFAYAYILKNTRLGRRIYMVGGNPTAARLAGINNDGITAFLFINASCMHVLAGIAWSCQKKMASPTKLQTAAPNFDALTAGILGGVAFFGGTGTMAGAFAGMMLVNVFTSGVIMLGLPSYTSIVLQGLILLVALILDNATARRAEKELQKAAMAAVKS